MIFEYLNLLHFADGLGLDLDTKGILIFYM